MLKVILFVTIFFQNGLDALRCPEKCHCAEENRKVFSFVICRDFMPDVVETFLRQTKGVQNLTLTMSTITPELWSLICKKDFARSLVILNLSGNMLQGFPSGCFKNMKGLKSLKADNNLIRKLDDGMFDDLVSLTNISLTNNNIEHIGKKVFTNLTALKHLYYVGLSDNILTTLDSWPLLLGTSQKAFCASLESNYISTLTNNLGVVVNCDKKFNFNLILNKNNITHLAEVYQKWGPPRADQLLCPGRLNNMISLEHNPLSGDCVDYVILTLAIALPEIFSKIASKSRERLLNDLEPKNMICKVIEDCPMHCMCFQRPYNHTLVVDCSKAELKTMPSKLPSRKPMTYFLTTPLKYDLIFSSHNLSSLIGDLLPSDLKYAESIDLSAGSISSIDGEAWKVLSKARRVLLHGNKLKTLPRKIESIDFHWKQVTLHDNPWSCTCENAWMKLWFETLPKMTGKILCSSPEWLANVDLLTADFCHEPVFNFTLLLKILLPPLFIICIAAIAYWARLKLKKNAYENGMRYVMVNSRDEYLDEELYCDIFLSCSDQDKEEGDKFFEELEKKHGFAVMHRSTDFSRGIQTLENNADEAISDCKHTICLLSKAYFSSPCCVEELALALMRDKDSGYHRLIIVLLEPIDLDRLKKVSNYPGDFLIIKMFGLSKEEFWACLLSHLPLRKDKETGCFSGPQI